MFRFCVSDIGWKKGKKEKGWDEVACLTVSSSNESGWLG